ncbi:hypothetical protein D9M71_544660 [compost metagenome]
MTKGVDVLEVDVILVVDRRADPNGVGAGILRTTGDHRRNTVETEIDRQGCAQVHTGKHLVPGRREVDRQTPVVTGRFVDTAVAVVALVKRLVFAIEAKQIAVVQLAQQAGRIEQRRGSDRDQSVDGPVQRVASGGHAVTVAGCIGDYACRRTPWREQTKTGL